MTRTLRAFALLAALGALPACGSYDRPSAPNGIAGEYTATTFTTTFNGVTTDQLAAGVTITITLAPNGTTTGTLFVPTAGNAEVDLGGEWMQSSGVVTFHQSVDTFIAHLQFEIAPGELVGEGTVGGNMVHLTLSR